jgi:hypothetical protein
MYRGEAKSWTMAGFTLSCHSDRDVGRRETNGFVYSSSRTNYIGASKVRVCDVENLVELSPFCYIGFLEHGLGARGRQRVLTDQCFRFGTECQVGHDHIAAFAQEELGKTECDSRACSSEYGGLAFNSHRHCAMLI